MTENEILKLMILILTIGMVVMLPVSIWTYRRREFIANTVLSKLAIKKKEYIRKQCQRTIKYFRVLRWFFPFIIVFVPYAFYTEFQINIFLSTVFVILLSVTSYILYLEMKWRVGYFEEHDQE